MWIQLLTIFTTCSVVDAWQGSEYASVSDFEYIRVLNMPGLHKVLNISEYAWIYNSWTCLNIPKYMWINLNLPEWPLFFPIVISCLLEHVDIYLHECLHKTKSYSLNEYEAVFSKRQKLIFSIVAGSVWFGFCFRLNTFTKFQITLFN